MSQFEPAVNYALENEGGLVERESDPGGITNYGISLRFLKNMAEKNDLRKYGILNQEVDAETIRNLTIEQAKGIYLGEFWMNAPFEKIENQEVCNYIFDTAVNTGIAMAIKLTQRACWSYQEEYNIIIDDGILGEKTLELINDCSWDCLLHALRSERAGYYRLLADLSPSLRENLVGWLRRAYGYGSKR